jgi:DNA-binding NtrC family response regulator
MRFSPDVLRRLVRADWPGNVRQLRNEVMRLAACCAGEAIVDDDPWQDMATPPRKPSATPPAVKQTTLKAAIEELERQMIREALESTRANQLQAARMLGLSRQGLINKMKRYTLA